jgi:flagellar basal-body rod modification protein FlgD
MTFDPTRLAATSGLIGGLPSIAPAGFDLAGSTGLLAADDLPTTGTVGAGTRLDRGGDTSDVFGLGRDDFFKLFLAQLRNQDPTQPMDDKEFLAQLAQFSLIDTMNEVRRVMAGTQLAQASSLIGQRVEGWADDGTPVDGIVERIVQDEKGIILVVDGWALRPESVKQVTSGEPDSGDAEADPTTAAG